MTDTGTVTAGPGRLDRDHPRYKWVALSNTTLGMTMATINSSIVLISLPAIFRGINLNPLDAANVSYLLWMLLGFLLVTAVLVVTFGRLGDIYGRVRIYNIGFLVFALASIALSLVPWDGEAGALWLIGFRAVQAVGAAMLMANATAILTDAFPVHQRGTALGINQVAAIAGSFLGLVIGGVLSEWHWRAVFWVSVPFGVVGAIWSYLSLHEVGAKRTRAGSTSRATSRSHSAWACCSPASRTACSPTAAAPWAGPTRPWSAASSPASRCSACSSGWSRARPTRCSGSRCSGSGPSP
jgi:MFS family permease